MSPTVLSVAYPFAPVGPDAVGGAEQILSAIDHGLVDAGWRSVVLAHPQSRTDGTLIAAPALTGTYDRARRAVYHGRYQRLLAETMACVKPDLVHMHGVDFTAYLPPAGMPVLATLHLPVDFYGADVFAPKRPDTWLHCVSRTQHEQCPASPALLPWIENGVALTDGPLPEKSDYALMLTRICPEKGIDTAIDAAKRAGATLVIAGQVFPYPEHQRYFAEEVMPRLDAQRRFIGPVGGTAKRDLLQRARCLLVASRVAETSSLAAREAVAAGTPVIAFRRGALAETVEHGRTGFLVEDEEEMAQSIRMVGAIDPDVCRETARARFSLAVMIEAYLRTYEALSRTRRGAPSLMAVQ